MKTHALDETKKLGDLELQLRSKMAELKKRNHLSSKDAHAINNALTALIVYKDLRADELRSDPTLLGYVLSAKDRANELLGSFEAESLASAECSAA